MSFFMRFYKRHIGDYITDTSHLSLLEHGAYNKLIDVYYSTESAINDKAKYRVISAISPDEQTAVDAVLSEFFELEDGFWLHPRCEQELEKYRERQNTNRENATGKRAARKRKANGKGTASDSQASRVATLVNGYWLLNKDKCFEEFWSLYPKKVKKKPAEQKWNKLDLTEDQYHSLMQSLSLHIRSEDWTKQNGRYVPDPTTWLNQERWKDEIQARPKRGFVC